MTTQEQTTLKEAISQYETQLAQIRFAVDSTSPGSDQDNLISLLGDIQELITLTKENLVSLQGKSGRRQQSPINVSSDDDDDNDPFSKEYARFKAEMASCEASAAVEVTENQTPPDAVDIQSDLNELQGMKCQAPHSHQWGGSESYHNALVSSVEPSDDITNMNQIQVRVMFTNPTHQEMLPCPYFLEGECRFTEDRCLYSHGEVVNLSDLKEYREPDFSVVRIGSRVLVKQKDKLWHRAVVTSMHASRCDVKFESSRGKAEVDLQDILPMTTNDGEGVSASDSSGEDFSEDEADLAENLVHQSLLVNAPSSALGGWEEYTKGFGSRMMARMGYVFGSGLGKCGEGRIEPVEAIVLPPGKSLDHCMALREQAGGDENLFKVDRRMRRIQRKQQLQREKRLASAKQNARTDVFSFINNTLGGKRGNPEELSRISVAESSPSCKLKSESSRGLNVVGFQLSEEIRRSERDLVKLGESLARHSEGSATHKTISGKLRDKEGELRLLRANEKSVEQERNQRKDRKKLSVF